LRKAFSRNASVRLYRLGLAIFTYSYIYLYLFIDILSIQLVYNLVSISSVQFSQSFSG
jgi:hypothetical protein